MIHFRPQVLHVVVCDGCGAKSRSLTEGYSTYEWARKEAAVIGWTTTPNPNWGEKSSYADEQLLDFCRKCSNRC